MRGVGDSLIESFRLCSSFVVSDSVNAAQTEWQVLIWPAFVCESISTTGSNLLRRESDNLVNGLFNIIQNNN